MLPRAVCQNFRGWLPRESLSRPRTRPRVRGFVAVRLFLIAWWVGAMSIIEGFGLEAPLLILVHLCVCGAALVGICFWIVFEPTTIRKLTLNEVNTRAFYR